MPEVLEIHKFLRTAPVYVRFAYPEEKQRWGDHVEFIVGYDSRFTVLDMSDGFAAKTKAIDTAPGADWR